LVLSVHTFNVTYPTSEPLVVGTSTSSSGTSNSSSSSSSSSSNGSKKKEEEEEEEEGGGGGGEARENGSPPFAWRDFECGVLCTFDGDLGKSTPALT